MSSVSQTKQDFGRGHLGLMKKKKKKSEKDYIMKIIICYSPYLHQSFPHFNSSHVPCLYQIPQCLSLLPFLFIFPLLSSHLLSPLHFSSLSQIFGGLSLTSVLSCLPYTVSGPLWGDKTRMSSTYETLSSCLFPSLSLWDSSPGKSN